MNPRDTRTFKRGSMSGNVGEQLNVINIADCNGLGRHGWELMKENGESNLYGMSKVEDRSILRQRQVMLNVRGDVAC